MLWNDEEFWEQLEQVQQEMTSRYAELFNHEDERHQMLAYIRQYLEEHTDWPDILRSRRAEDIYAEMAEYGFLTPYLRSDRLEEININAWNDVAVTDRNGKTEKLQEHFRSPQHAENLLKRLLHHSGMIVDGASPMAQGHLPGNIRITVLKSPLVDRSCGIAASIRFLHPSEIRLEELAESGFAPREELDFLCMCARYGVPFVIAGATGSGKTTLLNAVLATVPPEKRIFTIETGSRELSLVRRTEDGVENNVIHTLSRPSESSALDISQEDLVVASLRFHPDLVCVGEMRDVECYAAVEASLTGHTVVSTVHAGAGESAHTRIALLCQKRFPLDFSTSMLQAAQAFPVIVFTHQLEDKSRRIMDVTECRIDGHGKRCYHSLYRYQLEGDRETNRTVGSFRKAGTMSQSLYERLLRNGAPVTEIESHFRIRKEDSHE